MSDIVPATPKSLKESLDLSAEILRNIELNEISLASIALKSSRLARLVNDFDMMKVFEHESGGYPTTPQGVSPEIFEMAIRANRGYQRKDTKTEQILKYVYLESIGELEDSVKLAESSLSAAKDPSISIASANPRQTIWAPVGNKFERDQIVKRVQAGTQRLASRRALLHSYALKKHYELKYSGISEDVFSRIRERVDDTIGKYLPDTVQKLTAVYDNLLSENPEDWSNAVHSCRRVLQDLADATFLPQTDRVIDENGKEKAIKLGKDNYINRLIAFAQDHAESEKYQEIVGSHLRFLGDRLDSIFRAAQKGSHDVIVSREEADRYVVYTYMVVGDILSLINETSEGMASNRAL